MIKTAQEGLDIYKATLKKYREWSAKLTESYDSICGKGKWSPMANFSSTELQEANEWNDQLRGMVKVLGLSKEEEAAIDKECGIKTAEELQVA